MKVVAQRNSSTLGYEAESGQNNYIYVRMRNRGGSNASNVTATIYWAPVATLITPDLWSLVGTVTLPNVPTGDILTVSPSITWMESDIPATGHYCLVGIIGNSVDPAPNRAHLLTGTTSAGLSGRTTMLLGGISTSLTTCRIQL